MVDKPPKAIAPELVALIGAIYDCVIEPQRWYGTIDATRRYLNMHNGMLGVIALPEAALVLRIPCGVPPEYVAMMDSFPQEDGYDLWGGIENIGRASLEEPNVMSRSTPDHAERWERNRYAQAYAVPQGIVDSVSMILARDRTTYAGLEFSIHKSRGPIEEHEIETLRLLAPHFRRAVTISRLLETATTTAHTFAGVLDASPAGVVIVDDKLGIVHANAKAQAMLDAGDPIRERQGRLELLHEFVPGRMRAAVESAVSSDAADSRNGLNLLSRWANGIPAVVNVLPLVRRRTATGLAQRAVAAVFVAEAAGPPQLPADALAMVYSLTPAETRVFELIAAGKSATEVAAELGSAHNTVRAHLRHIFEKTGCHRQAELANLARTVTLPS